MTEFRARVRAARMKGSNLVVLPTPQQDGDPADPENYVGKLIEHAKAIGGISDSDCRLDGYLIIGLFEDGKSSMAWRMPERIPGCLAPAYVAELTRRDLVSERSAERVFDEKFQWVEG